MANHDRSFDIGGDVVVRRSSPPSLSMTSDNQLEIPPRVVEDFPMSTREKTLTINEIFHSIQGESTYAGRPCVFVRLTACDLRCSWCDTPYAFHEGKKMDLDAVLDEVERYGCDMVEVTGGEPLLQQDVYPLMQ